MVLTLLLASSCAPGGGGGLQQVDLTTLDGGRGSLEEFSGEWVVVNFWASFCSPCIREMPELQKLHEFGVLVVGVNALDRPDLALRFIAETEVTYPMLVDERGDLMAAASVTALPATLVLDPSGEVRARKAGEVDFAGLMDLIARAGHPSG